MTTIPCVNCGAELAPASEQCPYCGTQTGRRPLVADARADLERMLRLWAEPFRGVKTRADDAGVVVFFATLAVSVLGAVIAARVAAWGWLAVTGLVIAGLLLALGLAIGAQIWLAERMLRRTYARQVEPQIDAYLAERHIDRWTLKQIAAEQLGTRSPLRRYLLADAD